MGYTQTPKRWVLTEYLVKQLEVTDKQLEAEIQKNIQFTMQEYRCTIIFGLFWFRVIKGTTIGQLSFSPNKNIGFWDTFGKPHGYFYMNGIKIYIVMKNVPNDRKILLKHFTEMGETEFVKWNDFSKKSGGDLIDWTCWDYYFRNGTFKVKRIDF